MIVSTSKKSGTWTKNLYFDTEQIFEGAWNDCDLFLGNLPHDFTIQECLIVVGMFGRVYSISFMNKNCSCVCKTTHAFVRYHDPLFAEEASKGLRKLGARLGLDFKVILTRRQREIHVSNIPTEMSDEQLFYSFSCLFKGLESISTIRPYSTASNTFSQKNSGIAVMKFKNHGAAVKAIRHIKCNSEQFYGRNLFARWISPGKLHRHAILTGSSPTIFDPYLLSLIQLSCNNGLHDYYWSNGNVYLQFRTNAQAEKAMAYLDGKEINGTIIGIVWNVLPECHTNLFF